MQHASYPEDSKRLATLKVLTDLLSTVTPDNGYGHDLTDRVYRGRYTFTRANEVPAVAILENMDPDRFPRMAGQEDQVGNSLSNENWVLLLQGWVPDDKKNPTDPAYELMADVRKALSQVNEGGPVHHLAAPTNPWWRLGGLVSGMTMEPGVARPPSEQTSSLAYFWMRVTLKFVEDASNPFDHMINQQ